MKRENKLDLALNILGFPGLNMDLSMNKFIKDQEDFEDISLFFSKYNSKYTKDLISFSPNTFTVKKEYIVISKIFQNLVRLHHTHFEKISAQLSIILNYSNFYATKPTKDEGIDFIADRIDNDYLNTEEILFGQCKKFEKSLVTVSEIRELAGSVTLFKMNEFMNDKSYISIAKKIKSHSSLKIVFVTSYFFSEEAEKLCLNSGIVPIDIIDLTYLFMEGIIGKKINWSDKNYDKFYISRFNDDIEKVTIIK